MFKLEEESGDAWSVDKQFSFGHEVDSFSLVPRLYPNIIWERDQLHYANTTKFRIVFMQTCMFVGCAFIIRVTHRIIILQYSL